MLTARYKGYNTKIVCFGRCNELTVGPLFIVFIYLCIQRLLHLCCFVRKETSFCVAPLFCLWLLFVRGGEVVRLPVSCRTRDVVIVVSFVVIFLQKTAKRLNGRKLSNNLIYAHFSQGIVFSTTESGNYAVIFIGSPVMRTRNIRTGVVAFPPSWILFHGTGLNTPRSRDSNLARRR